MRLVALLGVILLGLTGACSNTREPFDEKTRFPDDAGFVSRIDFQFVQLDGERRYRISPQVESFTSRQHKVTALLSWKNGWYVHLGLEEVDGDKEVAWIAGIGLQPESGEVLYPGVFDRLEKGKVIFKEGTVLTLAEGVEAAASRGDEVLATIDAKTDLVTSFRVQGVASRPVRTDAG